MYIASVRCSSIALGHCQHTSFEERASQENHIYFLLESIHLSKSTLTEMHNSNPSSIPHQKSSSIILSRSPTLRRRSPSVEVFLLFVEIPINFNFILSPLSKIPLILLNFLFPTSHPPSQSDFKKSIHQN